MTSHDSLARRICNELIDMDNGYGVQTLAKSLTLLDLSMDNEMLAKDLKNLCDKLVEVLIHFQHSSVVFFSIDISCVFLVMI